MATTRKGRGVGTLISTGESHTVIQANESTNVNPRPGKVGQVIVWGVGTAWVLDLYDHDSANSNPVWQWVTADGKGVFALQLPLSVGLRVVTSGTTAGSVTIVWS